MKGVRGMNGGQAGTHLFLTGDAIALDLAGSERGERLREEGEGRVLPAGVAGGVLFARRGEGLCKLVYLVLHELSGEDETWRV